MDTSACTAIEFSDTLGQGLRDIECDQFSTGNYGCAIQSFDDATITACSGSSGADFTCGSAVPAGDGVSLAATVNDAGNLAVMGADFTDSSISRSTPNLILLYFPAMAPIMPESSPWMTWETSHSLVQIPWIYPRGSVSPHHFETLFKVR